MKQLHIRHVAPNLRLENGKRVAGLQTERSCATTIALYEAQIAKIHRQMQGGGPHSVNGNPELYAAWKERAASAIEYKTEVVAQIRVSLELAREARRRQLADLRVRREADARKLEKVRLANQHPNVAIRYFRDECRRQLSEEQYDALWEAANAARRIAGDAREKDPVE